MKNSISMKKKKRLLNFKCNVSFILLPSGGNARYPTLRLSLTWCMAGREPSYTR